MLAMVDDGFITLSKPITHSMWLCDEIDILRSEYLRTHRLVLGSARDVHYPDASG